MASKAITLPVMHEGQRYIYQHRTKRTIVRCGRRWGKSTMLSKWSASWALEGKKVGIFTPTYRLMRPMYDELLRTLRPVVASASKLDSIIELKTGGSCEFWTLGDPDAGRSRKYHEVLIDESSLAPGLEDIFQQSIQPTLLDYNGNATMCGTPKGIDEDSYFYKACNTPETWRQFHAPTHSNPTLNPEAVAALEASNHPLVFRQEYLAEFISWQGEAFFSVDKLLNDGKPVPLPIYVDSVFAVVDTAMRDGAEHDATAVVWCARSTHSANAPLTILDWDVVSIDSDLLANWLPAVIAKSEEYARLCVARSGSLGVFIENKASGITLVQHGQRQGWPVLPIDSALTQLGKDSRAIAAASPVWRNDVKLSEQALNKTMQYRGVTKNHLISQVTGFIVGDKAAARRADDLLDAFTYSVCISLNGPDGF